MAGQMQFRVIDNDELSLFSPFERGGIYIFTNTLIPLPC